MKFLVFLLLSIPALASSRVTFSDGTLPTNVGTVDPSFNITHQPNGKINDILVLEDGRIVVGGEFTKCGEIDQAYIAMFEEDGTFLPTFAPKLDGKVNTLAETQYNPATGSFDKPLILAGGAFSTINETPQGGIAYLEADGSQILFEYPIGFNGEVHAILPGEDSAPLIGGDFSKFTVGEFQSPAGNLAQLYFYSFGGFGFDVQDYEANGPVYCLEDGDPMYSDPYFVWVGGAFTTLSGQNTPYLTGIYNGTGTNQFNSPIILLNSSVREIVSYGFSNEFLVVRGDFTSVADESSDGITFIDHRYNLDESRDITPDTLATSRVTSLARGIDGQVWLGHENGEISQYTLDSKSFRDPKWNRNTHVASSGITGGFSLTSSLADSYLDMFDGQLRYRFGANTYHASEKGNLVRLRGLHGDSVPPPPSISAITGPGQLLAALPLGLSLLETQCEMSHDQGQSWSSLALGPIYAASGLFPNHDYQVRARYRNSNGFGPYSTIQTVTTPPHETSESSIFPLSTRNDESPSFISRIYKSNNNQFIVNAAFETPGSWQALPGLALFDANLDLISVNTSLNLHQSYPHSFAPFPTGGGVYISEVFQDGEIVTQAHMLTSDLSLNPFFSSIPLRSNGYVSVFINSPTNQLIITDTSRPFPKLSESVFLMPTVQTLSEQSSET